MKGLSGLFVLIASISLSLSRPQQRNNVSKDDDRLSMKIPECNKPDLELLLLQTNFAFTFSRTKYGVCPKEATEEEHDLLERLKELRSVGMKEYLRRKQKCKLSQLHFPAPGTTIEEEEEEDKEENLYEYFPEGTEIEYNGCDGKGSKASNNTINMCHTCSYFIYLPMNYYPRAHRHVTCHKTGDYSCFSGSGVCVMNNVNAPILFDKNEVGYSRLSEWDETFIQFTKSCSCQIIKDDIFEKLVAKN